tara:strand:+ start:2546 stop:3679 length:1134 start_codon:yes stop_codon:yes gene_type:complete
MASELRVDQLKNSGSATTNIQLNSDGTCTFGGDIDVGNNSLLVNGSPFSTLPPQYPEGNENSTVGAALKSDGTNAYWDNIVGFAEGFAITRGYPAAGYKSSSAWRNINRTTHSTFSNVNVGDRMDQSDAYTAGAQNANMRAYVFCTANGWNNTGNYVSTFSMVTESNAGAGQNMSTSRNRTSVMKRDFKYAYVCGNNNNNPDRYDLTNDSVTTVGGSSSTGGDNPACGYGETKGWYKQGGTGHEFVWATQTWSSWSSAPGTDGTNKTWSSRLGYMYWNTGGGYQTNSNMSRRDDTTGSELNQVGKPGTTGEETFHTGMTHGFMVGMYNGSQNNTGGQMDFSTHSFGWNGSLNSQGTPGRASGAAIEYGTLGSGYTGV